MVTVASKMERTIFKFLALSNGLVLGGAFGFGLWLTWARVIERVFLRLMTFGGMPLEVSNSRLSSAMRSSSRGQRPSSIVLYSDGKKEDLCAITSHGTFAIRCRQLIPNKCIIVDFKSPLTNRNRCRLLAIASSYGKTSGFFPSSLASLTQSRKRSANSWRTAGFVGRGSVLSVTEASFRLAICRL